VRVMILRIVAMVSAVLTGTVLVPGPAFAHSKVTIQPAQAGATDAVITVNVEAESTKAGAVSVRVVLPDGIVPTQLTYVSGPSGWAMKPETDGYTVSGPALAPGKEANHRIKARQLPMAPEIAFKVVQTYSDGQVDRWIEPPSAANPDPANLAPVVKLAAPPGGFPPPSPSVTPSSAAPSLQSAASSSAAATPGDIAATPTAGSGGSAAWPWILLVIGLVAAAAVVTFLIIRRRAVAAEES
jgi:uncharacterized protein YcnI